MRIFKLNVFKSPSKRLWIRITGKRRPPPAPPVVEKSPFPPPEPEPKYEIPPLGLQDTSEPETSLLLGPQVASPESVKIPRPVRKHQLQDGLGATRQEVPDIVDESPCRIWAFVIAIDIYQNPDIPNLSGCENDGRRFTLFLKEVLFVPDHRIRLLVNEEATRSAIIQAFEGHFIGNRLIGKGDAMIFYFAGHGARVQAPLGWLADRNMVETMCPYDEGMQDAEGNLIYGIPDRTFDGLMRRLAFEKGDNITAIFDSCYSGGVSRGDTRARTVPPNVSPQPLPEALDQDLWKWGLSGRTATTVVPNGFLYKALSSHVLLAACRPNELALESNTSEQPAGAFTTALVTALRECAIGQVTYSRLIELLPRLQYQHPQCEGANKDRIIFNADQVIERSKSFKVFTKEDNIYIEAGSIHGVVEGTEFAVQFPSDVINAEGIAARDVTLVAVKVDPLRCTVFPKDDEDTQFTLAQGSRAIVSYWNAPRMKVRFHLPAGRQFAAVLNTTEHSDIAVIPHERKAWQLERLDPLTRRHASPMVDMRALAIADLLDAVAHFNFHLYRANRNAPLRDLFTVQLHQLQRRPDSQSLHLKTLEPVGDDYLACEPDPVLCPEGSTYEVQEIKEAIITNMDEYYGLTLVNYSKFDLFPYVFYFDPSDYSVQAWYLPPSPTMAAPLPRKSGEPSKLPIGYGASGSDSIMFSIPGTAKGDSGFLKVFASTSHVDMAVVKQTSPLTEPPRHVRTTKLSMGQMWDAWTFVLTCRRPVLPPQVDAIIDRG